jgi:hypothetical protein
VSTDEQLTEHARSVRPYGGVRQIVAGGDRIVPRPDGPTVKIAGESLWLRYQWDAIAGTAVWLVVFGVGLSLAQRRLRSFEEEEKH